MHDVSHASTRLRDLFALCDELDRIAERLDDGATPRQTERLMQEKARARRRMRELLAEGLPEPLHRALGVRGRGPLGLDEAVLLLLLLNRRIRDAEPGASGRELLWTVCDNAYEVLAALPLLGRDSDLLRRGLVVVEDEGVVEADALDRVFQFSPYVFDSIAGGPGAAGDGDGAEPRPFADDADFMLALNGLARAYQRRAAKVFGEGHWCEVWETPWESTEALTAEIDRLRAEIAGRFEVTPDRDDLALFRLKQELGLSGLELLIVTALLCLEALSGQGQLDTIEVLRMVSASERDLLRKRVLLAPRSQLVESGAVVLEDGFGDKNLTGVAHLADWVTERLVDGSLRSNRRIQSDERIEFHRYLSNLDGSEDFFRKLD